MEFVGGEAGSESEGMIPRAVRLIFQMCEALKEKGWVYKIEASFLEIYNEQIRDLLGPSGQVHEIRVINNEVTVTNLKVTFSKLSLRRLVLLIVCFVSFQTEEVTNERQVNNLLARAQQQRAVASTSCNEHSSRSHSVLRLKLTGSNEATGESSHGNQHLVPPLKYLP